MKTLTRKVGLLSVALLLASVLILTIGAPRQASAGCGSDVTWSIWNVLDSRQTSDTQNGRTVDTQDTSSRSEHHSDNGQDWNDTQTNHVNPDGSSHDHEESSYSDSEGKGCSSDGIPWKFTDKSDVDKDSKGNRKEHSESIEEKNGKCFKWVRDREWDSKGKLIKDVKSTTEIPCSKYNLQVNFKGTKVLANMTATYGPNNIIVHLEDKGKIYEGKYESVLDGNVTGFCNGSITWPVLIEVTGTKYEDKKELIFSVKTTMGEPKPLGTCKNLSGNMRAGAITVPPHLFRIPEEGEATYSVTEDPITWTYTLVQK
jgi:hypothetical protein